MGRMERYLREIVSTKYTVIESAENPSQMSIGALE